MRTFFGCILICLSTMALTQAKDPSKHRKVHIQACEGAQRVVPDGFRIICSATWQFSGTCDGSDQWDKWRIAAGPSSEGAFIRPWESVPIAVLGYELVKTPGDDRYKTWRDWLRRLRTFDDVEGLNARRSWFMIGSGMNAQPDAMLWLGPGETRSKQMWPSGFGQLWLSKQDTLHRTRFENVMTLHGVCYGGGPVTMFLTIYYSPISLEATTGVGSAAIGTDPRVPSKR
jgi:hypothetical protein